MFNTMYTLEEAIRMATLHGEDQFMLGEVEYRLFDGKYREVKSCPTK